MFVSEYIKDIDMPRNLDLTSLRSFVAVADAGGVTRAAGFLNLTQSAVSMQLKRLEESLGTKLLDRSARTIALTPTGERLLTYARRMLDLNDEIFARMTDQANAGSIFCCRETERRYRWYDGLCNNRRSYVDSVLNSMPNKIRVSARFTCSVCRKFFSLGL